MEKKAKRTYTAPAVWVCEMKMESPLLAGSDMSLGVNDDYADNNDETLSKGHSGVWELWDED